MSTETPRVESFVIRFVRDTPESQTPLTPRGWHGVVVHVQTNEEKSFVQFADAIAFIKRYVPVGEFDIVGEDDKAE
ncbi:MAG: hypothetical protein M1132_01190 [Chloroflexi bacterium]|nr:hypothetical protein [Chloroflexota bacterium]